MLLLGTGFALSACQSGQDITGSINGQPASPALSGQSDQALHSYAENWRLRYEANPNDKQAAINYARALRSLTQYSQAAAILQGTAIKYPDDLTVLGEYGKALVDAGRWKEASDILVKAHHPENPNWSILSAQGVVADQLDDHKQAQNFYISALKIVPNEPSVMSNLAMSYVLSKQLGLAESTLRQALQNPRADLRVRQNMVFVLALEGKYQEANMVASQGVSPQDSQAIITSVREMLANGSSAPPALQTQAMTTQTNQPSNLQNFDLAKTARAKQNKAKNSQSQLQTQSLAAPPAAAPQVIRGQDYIPAN